MLRLITLLSEAEGKTVARTGRIGEAWIVVFTDDTYLGIDPHEGEYAGDSPFLDYITDAEGLFVFDGGKAATALSLATREEVNAVLENRREKDQQRQEQRERDAYERSKREYEALKPKFEK